MKFETSILSIVQIDSNIVTVDIHNITGQKMVKLIATLDHCFMHFFKDLAYHFEDIH